jgi:hypothetical protein
MAGVNRVGTFGNIGPVGVHFTQQRAGNGVEKGVLALVDLGGGYPIVAGHGGRRLRRQATGDRQT